MSKKRVCLWRVWLKITENQKRKSRDRKKDVELKLCGEKRKIERGKTHVDETMNLKDTVQRQMQTRQRDVVFTDTSIEEETYYATFFDGTPMTVVGWLFRIVDSTER